MSDGDSAVSIDSHSLNAVSIKSRNPMCIISMGFTLLAYLHYPGPCAYCAGSEFEMKCKVVSVLVAINHS